MSERILIVEDDGTLANLMRIQLEHDGYQAVICSDGAKAVEQARKLDPHLILLDILLPHVDGWTICEELQRVTDAPIIFTTALGAEHNLSRGMSLGADDYIIKPFSRKELLSRVKAALHRAQRGGGQKTVYRNGRLVADLENHVIQVDGKNVPLTPLEFKLLAALVQEAGNVIPHATLLDQVWGSEHKDQRQYLKLYIWYLRQKIEADPTHPTMLLTERGVGYRLVSPE